MLEKMKAEFEKWHGYSVNDDMDIHTAVAWDSWRIAWNAGAMAATVGLPELPTCTKSQTAAERYEWLRGGSDVPPHSVRWPRWEVRAWDGRHWQTLFAEQLDSAIDAAMSKDLAHNLNSTT